MTDSTASCPFADCVDYGPDCLIVNLLRRPPGAKCTYYRPGKEEKGEKE